MSRKSSAAIHHGNFGAQQKNNSCSLQKEVNENNEVVAGTIRRAGNAALRRLSPSSTGARQCNKPSDHHEHHSSANSGGDAQNDDEKKDDGKVLSFSR